MPLLGDDLKNMRERRGLTQSDLAHRAGVATSVITVAERGPKDSPSRWRYSTTKRVYDALASVHPLSPAEMEQFTAGTEIPFIEGALAGPAENMQYANSLTNLGLLLVELREDRKLTQQKLATLAGVSVNTISQVEKTGKANWDPDTAESVLRAFSTKFRLDDNQERAFRRMTGLDGHRDSTKTTTQRPSKDPLFLLSELQRIELDPVLRAVQRMYLRHGIQSTRLAIESQEQLLDLNQTHHETLTKLYSDNPTREAAMVAIFDGGASPTTTKAPAAKTRRYNTGVVPPPGGGLPASNRKAESA